MSSTPEDEWDLTPPCPRAPTGPSSLPPLALTALAPFPPGKQKLPVCSWQDQLQPQMESSTPSSPGAERAGSDWALVLTTLTSPAVPGPASCPEPYQRIDPGEGVIGIVQGVDQLVHPIVGLAVSIEANAHRSTKGKNPNEVRGGTRELF